MGRLSSFNSALAEIRPSFGRCQENTGCDQPVRHWRISSIQRDSEAAWTQALAEFRCGLNSAIAKLTAPALLGKVCETHRYSK